jgi:hypothetical protein
LALFVEGSEHGYVGSVDAVLSVKENVYSAKSAGEDRYMKVIQTHKETTTTWYKTTHS